MRKHANRKLAPCTIFILPAILLYATLCIHPLKCHACCLFSRHRGNALILSWKRMKITFFLLTQLSAGPNQVTRSNETQLKSEQRCSKWIIIRERHKPIWQQSTWTTAAALQADLYSWMGGERTNTLSGRHSSSSYSQQRVGFHVFIQLVFRYTASLFV